MGMVNYSLMDATWVGACWFLYSAVVCSGELCYAGVIWASLADG